MATLTVQTPEGLTLRVEIAGAGSRFGAALLDGLLFALGYVTLAMLLLIIAQADVSGTSRVLLGVLAVGLLLSMMIYLLLFHVLWNGQTPGKRAFGLRVSGADGYPPTTLQHVLRMLLWPIDVLLPLPVPFGILGIVVICLTERRQRIGDLVAGTLVLRERPPPDRTEPFSDLSYSTLERRTLALDPGMAARFDAADLELLRDLWTRKGISHEERRRLFITTARDYSKRLGLSEFDDARVVLKELFLFLREARG